MTTVIKLREKGCDRVLDSKPGMTFVVDTFTPGVMGDVAHVRDYRFTNADLGRQFQIWSVSADGYDVIAS